MRIPIANTKKRLTIIWFTGSGFLFALLLLQTIFGKYGTEISEIKDPWGLMLPTFIPTLSLIIGVLVSDATGSQDSEETATVDQFFFRLSCFLSIAYLVTVILTILLSPFAKLSLLELMKLSNLWLAPFQGLVTAALGAFFVSKK
ncbi:MAG: hypothetical protein D3914_02595 [Candidatus Electrothrix sp. LOE2]|jgi:hypothetical protein|nr:hypothetical protein [Candidatus Electrothrix sp. LOE2]